MRGSDDRKGSMFSCNTGSLETGLRPERNQPVTTSLRPYFQLDGIGSARSTDDEVWAVALSIGWGAGDSPSRLFEGVAEQFLSFSLSVKIV